MSSIYIFEHTSGDDHNIVSPRIVVTESLDQARDMANDGHWPNVDCAPVAVYPLQGAAESRVYDYPRDDCCTR